MQTVIPHLGNSHLSENVQCGESHPNVRSNHTALILGVYPHKNSTAPQFESNAWTAFLGSQLPEDLLLQTGLWIHGHTHHSVDFRLDGTVDGVKRHLRVICNPRGYPLGRTAGAMENPKFNPALFMAQLLDGNWAQSYKP